MAEVWLNSGLPAELCDKYPELHAYGMYRKLNDGQYELIEYCIPQSQNYFAIQKDKFNEILNKLLPSHNDD